MAGPAGPPAETILVLGTPSEPARPSLVDALRIQLAGSVSVRVGPVLPSGSVVAKLDAAARAVASFNASLAVWIELAKAADGSTELVLYAVGARSERGVIEIGRARADQGPEIDRVLAFKISALLDDLAAASDVERAAAALRAPRPGDGDAVSALPERDARAVPGPGIRQRRLGLRAMVETGVAMSFADREAGGRQLGLAIGLGARLERARWLAELYGSVRLLPQVAIDSADARVLVEELAGGVGARAAVAGEHWAVGLGLELGVRLLDANATASDGRTGSASLSVPVLWVGVEARARALPRVETRLSAGAEAQLIRQRFTALGSEVADYGRAVPRIELAVIFVLP